MNIISYSGGADSTALLIYCRENNISYEEVIYMEDWFPYPGQEMEKYFIYIEKKFNIKITKLPCNRLEIIRKNGGHHPRLPYPYCCRIKSEIFKNYVKEKYGKTGLTLLLGIRRAESFKRKGYTGKGKWYWNKRFSVDYDYWYPIFSFADSKHYCNIHGVNINPLYNKHGLKRLGCAKCYKIGDFKWKKEDKYQLILETFL